MNASPNRKNIQLMAPVGSYEALIAAIQGGADAIYFGVENLNMRSKSSLNFSLNDLRDIVKLAQKNYLKTYLTLNTVMYDNDLENLSEIIDVAREYGITAIIASDQAVLQIARDKGVEIHLSTQLNISNFESVKFFASFADVIVLARELNLEQINHIAQNIKMANIKGPSGNLIRIELFIHGALCMAISGKCYLSLHQYNYSANRGECLQVCRRSYIVTEKETGREIMVDNQYIMSPKDLCTIRFLDKILDVGISVLKIEGRARSPEYVKTVASCYNEGINAYFDGTFSPGKVADWEERLSHVFNRGFWEGYYLGREMGEWSDAYGSKATKRKVYLGKIKNFYSQIGVAEIILETGNLMRGDEILIIGPTTGVIETIADEIRKDDKPILEVTKSDIFSIVVGAQVRRNDKVYKVIKSDYCAQKNSS